MSSEKTTETVVVNNTVGDAPPPSTATEKGVDGGHRPESDRRLIPPIRTDALDSATPQASPTKQLRVLTAREISRTFRFMAFRKTERQVYGRYKRRSHTRVFWLIMFLLAFLSLMGAGIGGRLANVSTWRSWTEFAILTVVFGAIGYVYYKITEVVRWCFYWLAIATIILLFLNKGRLVADTPDGFASTKSTRIVLITLLGTEVVTLLIWVLIRFVYPKIVRNAEWLDTIWWWSLKEVDDYDSLKGEAVGCFRYIAWESYSVWFRHSVCKYVGEVDVEGKPHGRGEWMDDSFDGECLKGIWDHGRLVGPFHSRGSGTGDAFHTVRVGFVCNGHRQWEKGALFPGEYQKGLQYGVATVECSVSGKYLRHLPRSTLIAGSTTFDDRQGDLEANPDPIEFCLPHLITYTDAMGPDFVLNEESHASFVVRLIDGRINVPGYYPVDPATAKEQVVIRRVTKRDPERRDRRKYELSIEGWNPVGSITSPVSETSATSLSWPSPYRHHQECIIFIHGFNCPTKYAAETFGQFLALADLPLYIKPFVFTPSGSHALWYYGARAQGTSPEAVADFRMFLENLRKAGFTAVHLLSHSMGCMMALKYSEVFDSIFFRVGNPTISEMLPMMQLSTFTLLNPDTSLDDFTSKDYPHLARFCNHITIYSNERDFALRAREWLSNSRALGRYTSDLYNGERLLDVDLIDTTNLDVNIHKIRHNFFNLNRLLVDDLWDAIVLRRRASERRTRLTRKINRRGFEGVVYTFLVAPSYVVNK